MPETQFPHIYKVCPISLWQEAQNVGIFKGMAIDHQDGFIHFSTQAQLAETLRRHFYGQKELVLLTVDSHKLGERLKYEPSRGGDLFPHLYAFLPLDAIIKVQPLACDAHNTFILPF